MKRLLVTLAIGLFYASTASASTITFSEPGAAGASFLSSDGLVLVEWVWTQGTADGHSHLTNVGGNPGDFEQAHGQEFQGLRLSNVGGGAITLVSFDLQGDWWVSNLNDGSGTQYSAGFSGWVTQMANFTSTPYVYIYAAAPGASIVGPAGWLDNVVVNQTVPEPSTMLLMGSGLLAGVRRYRRRRA